MGAPHSGQDGLQSGGQNLLLSLSLGQILTQSGEVGLDLGLGAGGTNDNSCAAFQSVDQNVCCGQAGLFGLLVVNDLDNLVAADFSRSVLTQAGHDTSHLVHAGQAGELEGVDLVQVTAVLGIDSFQALLDGGTDGAVVSSHFADQHGADHGVLVADVGTCQVAVGLFEAQDEALHFACVLQTGDLIADPLEAGENVVKINAVLLAGLCGEGHRFENDGIDYLPQVDTTEAGWGRVMITSVGKTDFEVEAEIRRKDQK